MAAPVRFLSGRQQQQKIGIEGSTQNEKVLEVVGRVGIGTTVFDTTKALDVRGDVEISGIISATRFLGDGSQLANLPASGVGATDNVNTSGIITAGTFSGKGDFTNLSVSGLSTFSSTVDINSNLDVDGQTELDDLNVSGVSTFNDQLKMADNTKIMLGASNDMQIVHIPGTGNSIQGTQPLYLQTTSEIELREYGGSEIFGKFIKNGPVELYHDNSKKFETTASGIDVTGHSELDDVNVTGLTTTQNLNVAGVSTFVGLVTVTTGDVHIAQRLFVGGLEVEGTGSENTFTGINTFTNQQDNVLGNTNTGSLQGNGGLGIDKNASFGDKVFVQNAIGINSTAPIGKLDVNGHTELDDVNVSAALTAASLNVTNKLTTTGLGISVANGTGNTAYIEGPSEIWIDPAPAGAGTTSGLVRIRGDLYVDGTEFIVDVDKVQLSDYRIGIATTAGTNALLDGAGLGIGSESIEKTITWNNATSALMSSENWNLASGKHYEIAGTDVLTSTTLGGGVVNSSLTSVGTLGSLTVSGDITANGNIVGDNATNISNINQVTATTFSGALSGNATSATTATNVTVADESSDTTCNVLFTTGATGNLAPKSGTNLTFNSANGTLTATEFSGGGAGITGLSASQVGALADIVSDTTPQLGGNLDVNNKDITGTGNVNLTGIVTATNFVGGGAGLTGITAGQVGAITDLVSDTTPQLGGNLDLNSKLINGTGGINVTGIVTASSFDGNITGIATYTSEWIITSNGSSDYRFTGPGFDGTEIDPTIYLVRGQEYKFTNNMGAHPFQIRTAINGSAYNDGITNNGVSNGTLTWDVQMDAPNVLYYQCTAHAGMVGKIYIGNSGDSVNVGTGVTINAGGINVTGVVTATSFVGNGAGLSGLTANQVGAIGDVVSDTTPQLGGNLDLNSKTINGTGTINFTGNVTATAFSGDGANLTSLPVPTEVIVTDESSDTSCNVLFTTAATGNQAPKSGTNLTFNSSSGTLTATAFSGDGSALTNLPAGSTPDKIEEGNTSAEVVDTGSDGHFKVTTEGTERLRINPSGQVSIGTTTVGHAKADDLTIENSGDAGITIRSGTSDEGSLFFSDGTSGTSQYRGSIQYDHNTDILSFRAVGAEKLFLDSNGLSVTGDLTLTDSDGGSAAGPELKLYRNSGTPADADYLGQIKFAGESDTGVERNYAKITGKISDASNTSEDGILEFAHIKAGSQTITGRWNSTELQLLNGTHFSLGDSQEIRVGASDDLKIYHDGSNSYIKETAGTGNLRIEANDLRLKNGDGTEDYIKCNQNAAVELYYDNSKKLETTGYGATVTGGLQVSGISTIYANSRVKGGNLFVQDNLTGVEQISHRAFYNNSYYSNDVAKFVQKGGHPQVAVFGNYSNVASNTTMGAEISIVRSYSGTTGVDGAVSTAGAQVGGIKFGASISNQMVQAGFFGAFLSESGTFSDSSKPTDFRFYTNPNGAIVPTEKVRITSEGNVGIGSTIPTSKLDVVGDARVTGITTLQGNIFVPDNTYLRFGDGNDLSIAHVSSVNTFSSSSIHGIKFLTKKLTIKNETDNETGIEFTQNGSVDLYYDGSKKFETTSGGATVTGILTATTFVGALTGTASNATNITVSANNGNNETVYPVFVDGATGSQGAETDTALSYNPSTDTLTAGTFSGAHSGNGAALTSLDAGQLSSGVVPAARMSGLYNIESATFTVTANNSANETVYPVFVDGATGSQGAETDTGLSYNPSTGALTATSFSGSGANLTGISFDLVNDTTPQLGGDLNTNGNLIQFPDSGSSSANRVTFGDASDLSIYHDGSNSYISDTGTGNLLIRAESLVAIQDTSGNNSAIFNDGGTVELYHNNSLKFTTQSYGIDVTGEVQCDSLDVDGAADITGNVTLHANLDLQDNDKILIGTGDDLEIYHDGSNNVIKTASNQNLQLYSTGAGAVQIQSDSPKLIFDDVTGGSQIDISMTLDAGAFTMADDTNSDTFFKYTQNDAVEIYHNNSKKFETTGYGATVTGGLQVSGIVTATSFAGDGSALTGIEAGGSPEFYTGITSSRQIAPLSFETAVFTFPSTSGRQYVIESINVANVDASVGVGTTVNIIASIEDATAAEQTYIAYNVPIVTGGLIELLKNPIVAGPSDVIKMWTSNDNYTGVSNAADVYINYTEFESTDYISKFASSTTINSTSAVTLYTSTGNPTMIEKIGFANRTDTGDFPVSIKITNGVTTSYLAKNLIIPRYSTVDILDRHKRIETGAKIEVEVGSTNTVDVIISGKKITT